MRRNQGIFLVGIMVLALAGAAWFALRPETQAPAPMASPARPVAAPKPEAAAKPAAPIRPSFDAVHVGGDGAAVLAGRAAPGADVTVLDQGKPIGHVTADSNGEWVLLPAQKLPPGPQQLSLAARSPGAASPVTSDKALALLVPPRATTATPAGPPVAVLLPGANGGRPTALAGAARSARHVALDIVEYDARGETILSGRADAGAHVTLLVDGKVVGTATAGHEGQWSATLSTGVPVGEYRLRIEARAPDGSDAGRLMLVLRRAKPSDFGNVNYFAVVPGNTLWHLAQHSYGDGMSYVVLYQANRDKIRNPDLIYPNEFLALPNR